jgi:hypothetical protein
MNVTAEGVELPNSAAGGFPFSKGNSSFASVSVLDNLAGYLIPEIRDCE